MAIRTFLCTPTERHTCRVIGPDYTIEIEENDVFSPSIAAKTKASNLFMETKPDVTIDWYIDSVEF